MCEECSSACAFVSVETKLVVLIFDAGTVLLPSLSTGDCFLFVSVLIRDCDCDCDCDIELRSLLSTATTTVAFDIAWLVLVLLLVSSSVTVVDADAEDAADSPRILEILHRRVRDDSECLLLGVAVAVVAADDNEDSKSLFVVKKDGRSLKAFESLGDDAVVAVIVVAAIAAVAAVTWTGFPSKPIVLSLAIVL